MEEAHPTVNTPKGKASYFSLLTFSWMSDVLKLGSKQPLEEKHLFPIETSNQAESLTGDLEREWLAEERASEQDRTKPRLWRAMVRIIPCRELMTWALLRILYSLASNLLPLIVWFFLRSISTASELSYTTTLPFVLGITLTTGLRTICTGHVVFKVEMMVIRLKVAVIGFVYKKVSNCSLTLANAWFHLKLYHFGSVVAFLLPKRRCSVVIGHHSLKQTRDLKYIYYNGNVLSSRLHVYRHATQTDEINISNKHHG